MKALLYPIAAAALMLAVNANALHLTVNVDPTIKQPLDENYSLHIKYDYKVADGSIDHGESINMGDFPGQQLIPWLSAFNNEKHNIKIKESDSTITMELYDKTKPGAPINISSCIDKPLKNNTVINLNKAGCFVTYGPAGF